MCWQRWLGCSHWGLHRHKLRLPQKWLLWQHSLWWSKRSWGQGRMSLCLYVFVCFVLVVFICLVQCFFFFKTFKKQSIIYVEHIKTYIWIIYCMVITVSFSHLSRQHFTECLVLLVNSGCLTTGFGLDLFSRIFPRFWRQYCPTLVNSPHQSWHVRHMFEDEKPCKEEDLINKISSEGKDLMEGLFGSAQVSGASKDASRARILLVVLSLFSAQGLHCFSWAGIVLAHTCRWHGLSGYERLSSSAKQSCSFVDVRRCLCAWGGARL